MVTTTSATTTGKAPTIALWIRSGTLWLLEKTMTNENRYRESGITHKSGTGVMSVVMNAVTPSIRLEGTNANATHLSLLSSVGLLESPSANESPSGAPVSGAPPPAATGGFGEPPPAASTSSSDSSSCPVVVALAGAERHSTTAEAKTNTMNS